MYWTEIDNEVKTRIKDHLTTYRAAAAANLPALPADRGGEGEHRRKDVKSWMWEHCRDSHSGQVGDSGGMGDFIFKVSGVFPKCLNRQIDERLRITDCESEGVLLN